MERNQREVERVDFSADDLGYIAGCMARLASAEDGWINLVPKIAEQDTGRATSLGFSTLFGGGGAGITMCTWIPGTRDHRGRHQTKIGIAHLAGRRIRAELGSLGAEIPSTWFIEQDHPRRGLVVRIPPDEPNATVLAWAVHVVAVLSAPRPISGWRADVYFPHTA